MQSQTYKQRIARLREAKLVQTQEKIAAEGLLDEDDYGRLVPPKGLWKITPNHPDGSFYGFRAWTDNFCSLMDVHPVYVNPDDAFTGRWMYFMSKMRPNKWNPAYPYDHLKPNIEKYDIICGIGDDGHFAPDFEMGLQLGWGGILNKIDRYRKVNTSEKQQEFYDIHIRGVRSVQGWVQRHIDRAEKMATETADPSAKADLMALADTNRAILNDPPATFRQACQWLIWYHLASRTYNRDGAGGQIDALLAPYYDRDKTAGILDDETAVYYLACFLINDPVYWQLGGPDKHGKDQTSPISFLILQAADLINTSLNITVRVHDGSDPALFELAVHYLIKNKNGWPRFSGNALTEDFMKNGFPVEIARQRIAVGCNWMSLPGLEYTMNDLVKVNMAKVFEVAFQEMLQSDMQAGIAETGVIPEPAENFAEAYLSERPKEPEAAENRAGHDPEAPRKITTGPSTAKLWDYFTRHLQVAVQTAADGIRHHLKYQKYNEPELLLNLLSHGPLEKGKDVSDGGAVYYNLAIDGAGLAVVADSFAALELRIEKEKRLDWNQMKELLETDFECPGGEALRRLLQRSERFGSQNSLGEKWAIRVKDVFTEQVRAQSEPGKNVFIPGFFSWANTVGFGMAVGATPNGRKARTPISHGANPNPGFSDEGASLALASAVAAIQPGYGNTAPMQWELDPTLAREQHAGLIGSIIKAHFRLGGTLINVNIMDKDTVLAAHKDPLKYPELVVRVTGFTAYFCMLSPQFRQLVVDRILES